MHIAVCIKQVPDSAQIRVHPVTNTIMRQGVPAIINPFDLFALEEALCLKDRFGARVTVLSMGPLQAEEAMKKALSFGADEAILVTDKVFAGADTLATSYALAAALRRLNEIDPIDIVFTGKQTIDGDTAQVGPGLAIRLGFQLLSYVSSIERIDPETREIIVHRRAEGGVQVLSSRLPCVITMLEGTNEMRFASMPDMFRAARFEVKYWNRDVAGIEDVKQVGLKGSPTVVNKVYAPRPKEVKAQFITGETPGRQADALVAKLFADHPEVASDLVSHLALLAGKGVSK
ncbi:MAG: electron transfer flavoprotein subunit beta/FixA family protein [Betaproteobacteria bacterium]|nr:electron transfer flavoprotein subunit beta/FixA family protein [Betaproteobacteria bacterium]